MKRVFFHAPWFYICLMRYKRFIYACMYIEMALFKDSIRHRCIFHLMWVGGRGNWLFYTYFTRRRLHFANSPGKRQLFPIYSFKYPIHSINHRQTNRNEVLEQIINPSIWQLVYEHGYAARCAPHTHIPLFALPIPIGVSMAANSKHVRHALHNYKQLPH